MASAKGLEAHKPKRPYCRFHGISTWPSFARGLPAASTNSSVVFSFHKSLSSAPYLGCLLSLGIFLS